MIKSIAGGLARLSSRKFIPLDVTWEITKKCNLRCLPCYLVGSQKKELTFAEGISLLKELKKKKTMYLTFTGGEPFVRRDELKNWAFLAQGYGMAVTVFTNGTLIRQNDIRWLKKLSPFAVHISLFGVDKKIHDEITGVDGSHEKAILAVRMLKKAGVEVVLKMLLMKNNFNENRKIISFAEKLGVSWSIDPIVTPSELGGTEPVKHRISEKQVNVLYKNASGYFKSRFYPSSKNEFLCGAGVNLAAVSAYGDVYPCLMYPRKAGSVRNERFSYVWDNAPLFKKLRNLRTDDIKKCSSCSILKYCSRCPGLAMLEDGNDFGHASTSCMLAKATKKLVEA